MLTALKKEAEKTRYTYADYPARETDKQYELIGGGESLPVSVLPGLPVDFNSIRSVL
jgi:hypothetical protein